MPDVQTPRDCTGCRHFDHYRVPGLRGLTGGPVFASNCFHPLVKGWAASAVRPASLYYYQAGIPEIGAKCSAWEAREAVPAGGEKVTQ